MQSLNLAICQACIYSILQSVNHSFCNWISDLLSKILPIMQSDDTRRHVMSGLLKVLFFCFYLALRKPRVSESKGNLFALPSESGFVKQLNV